MKLLSFLVSFLLSFPNLQASQQAATSDTQGPILLQKALATLTGPVALTDATLAGTARQIIGSDDESGTAVFQALASGAGRTDMNLSSGERSEIQNLISTTPTGTWSGPDRISHPIAYHNLLIEPAWFFPAFAISRRLSGSGFVATYVGSETHNGHAVEHVSVAQNSSIQDPRGASTFQHLTQIEFFLDSTTLVPVAVSFNIHPDNNAALDIPVEIHFSDYRPVNGAQVSFHVQKFLNNTLILDFQAQTVTFNTGLAASTFSAQ